MFKRKIIDEMVAWKEDPHKKALIIKGLRQVGKTTIVKEFSKNNYENVVYVNLKNNEYIKEVFDDDLFVNRITTDISAIIPDAKFVPYKTVIIFDEIQECANARSSLKEFVEDGRYDVIATGSLLGIKGYNKKKSKGVSGNVQIAVNTIKQAYDMCRKAGIDADFNTTEYEDSVKVTIKFKKLGGR